MKASTWLASILLFALFSIAPRPLLSREIGADDTSEVANHMHQHLGRITTIKSQIIKGNLDGVREPAIWFAEHETVSGLPANFEPYIDMMRSHAREVVRAPDLKSAAVAVSAMARTCGSCHLANHVGLAFGYDTVPDEWADTISHMQRHQWAVDRLWEGMIGPSDVAWSRGSDMLVDVPLHPLDVMDETTSDADTAALDKIARRIHSLGSRGTDARTPDARSDLYGEVLGLCADCHTRLGRGP